MVKAALAVPFRVLYPTLQTGEGEQQTVRAYTLKDEQGRPHHAYVVVWQQNPIGGYYDFEGDRLAEAAAVRALPHRRRSTAPNTNS